MISFGLIQIEIRIVMKAGNQYFDLPI
jgi:hypothetical protein